VKTACTFDNNNNNNNNIVYESAGYGAYIILYCNISQHAIEIALHETAFFLYIILYTAQRRPARELCYIIGILYRHLLYVYEYYFVPIGKLLIKNMAQRDRDIVIDGIILYYIITYNLYNYYNRCTIN